MQPFYKTSYNRQTNFNNYLHSAQQKRYLGKQRQVVYNVDHKLVQKQKKFNNEIQKKIEIDPTLLFPGNKTVHKNTKKPHQNPQNIRKTNKSQAKYYETSVGFNVTHQRPQSKQQPRCKPNLKKDGTALQRPQTSKGQRITTNQDLNDNIALRKMSMENQPNQSGIIVKFGNNDMKQNNKMNYSISTQSKRNKNITPKLNFQTSIDPQFLALFAN